MNTQICSATNQSPYVLVFGQSPRSIRFLLEELDIMGIDDEEEIPNNVYIEADDEEIGLQQESSDEHDDVESSPPLPPQQESSDDIQQHSDVESPPPLPPQQESNDDIQQRSDVESPPPLPPPISFSFSPSPELEINETEPSHFDESNDQYSSDDSLYMSQWETGHYIKDNMMHKPFQICPPSRNRSSYVFALNSWLLYKTANMDFTLANKDFVLKCLEDLRNWNNCTPDDNHIVEEDQMSEIFEQWPERIHNWEERHILSQRKI